MPCFHFAIVQKRKGCSIKIKHNENSSNVNEVIRAVPKVQKAQKAQDARQKHKNANKRISDFFPLDVFYAHKNTAFFVFVRLYAFLCLIKM